MLLYITTGGDKYTMVAFDKTTGDEVWKTKSLGGAKSYASSVLVNHGGMDLILVQTTKM
jgi:outer membrane protein assembly factor BamB